MRDIAEEAYILASGGQVKGATKMSGHRRIDPAWLIGVNGRIRQLEKALRDIVKAWDSIDPNQQVPEEINANELWETARELLGIEPPVET